MTTIVGIVDGDTAYLAADRMRSFGNSYASAVKIRRHPLNPNVALAAAGSHMLTYPAELIDPPTDGLPPDRGWADQYWTRLLALASPPLDNDGTLDGNLLVLTPGAVTLIGSTGSPTLVDKHGVALGSGGDFALGAYHGIRAARPLVDTPTALTEAITIASRLDTGSGCGVDVVSLTRPTTEGHAAP